MTIAERTELAEEVGAVLHCAASISFDLPLEEARAINVEGTREVIGFAREAKALGRLERFVHVSTAYVSGAYPGTFRERQLVAGQEFRNTYEQTKWEAEQIVAEADDLAPAVVRPSIVMGESDSGWTPAFNVLYWPLRAFSRGLFDHVPALADGRVDVVPVDYVADGIVHLLDRAEAGVFNLVAGREAPTVDELIDDGHRALRHRRARSSSSRASPTALADGEVYVPYFDMKVVFDDSRARARARARRHPRPAAGGLLRRPDRLRRGRALGQDADEPPGRARAHAARGGLSAAGSLAQQLARPRDHDLGPLLGQEVPDAGHDLVGGVRRRGARSPAASAAPERVALADQQPRRHLEPRAREAPAHARGHLADQERPVHQVARPRARPAARSTAS